MQNISITLESSLRPLCSQFHPLSTIFTIPFDDSFLDPQTSAAVHGCVDCALHKGTAYKGDTNNIVYIINLYIFYNFLKDSTKVS